jgi:hypothetical protein
MSKYVVVRMLMPHRSLAQIGKRPETQWVIFWANNNGDMHSEYNKTTLYKYVVILSALTNLWSFEIFMHLKCDFLSMAVPSKRD